MENNKEQTNAQKTIMDRINIKSADQSYGIYEDHVDSYVL